MYEFHRINIRSLAKIVSLISFVVYIFFGAALTALYWLIRLVFSADPFGVKVSVFSFFLVWLASALAVLLIGYLLGLVSAFVYNRTTRWWGGIQVELTKPESTHAKHEPS